MRTAYVASTPGSVAHRLHQPRDVALDELVLERERRGGDHHPLVVEQRGHQVAERLAGAGAGLDEQVLARPRTPRRRRRPSRSGRPAAGRRARRPRPPARRAPGWWRVGWRARAPGHSSQRHRPGPAPTRGCPQAAQNVWVSPASEATPAASSSAKVTVQPRPRGDSANFIVRPLPGARRTVVTTS